MRMSYLDLFLDGDIAVHVSNEKQSQYIIQLIENSGLTTTRDFFKFPIEAFKIFPYYYVKDGSLSAGKVLEDVKRNCSSVVKNFDEVFSMSEQNMKNTKVLVVFPGCGRTRFYENHSKDITVSNVTLKDGSYISNINNNLGMVDYILTDFSKESREALKQESIPYTIILPADNMKEEIVGRCFLDKWEHPLCEQLALYYEQWLSSLISDCYRGDCEYYFLGHEEVLSDVIKIMEADKQIVSEINADDRGR